MLVLLRLRVPRPYNKSMYVGIDIGGTKILAAASTTGRTMGTSQKIATPSSAKAAVEAIVGLVHQVADGHPVASIGVSSPGWIDHGTVMSADNIGWHNVNISSILSKRLHAHVTLENDAACGGLAETILGAAKGYRHVLYVTISTGVGTSLIVDGKIFRGSRNLEGGHITLQKDGPLCSCGAKGHFESLVSGKAIKRDYGKYAYEIKDAKTWDKIAENMAMGIASLIAAEAPDVVILAGGVSVHWQHFKRPLQKKLSEFWTGEIPPIKLAKFVETAPVIGALLLASQAEQLLL